MKINYIVSIILFLFISNKNYSQTGIEAPGEGAFLFGYYPKANQIKQFEEGYKKHLEWHRNKKDQLVWYAWYVQTGTRLGLFIDGTFGTSFSDFDNRVDMPEDRKDFAETTAPFADINFRKIYQLKNELSSGNLLEERNPSNSIEVFYFIIQPGKENQFEKIFSTLSEKFLKIDDSPNYTLYILLSGGTHSEYMLMVPRNNFSYFEEENAFISLYHVVKKYLNPEKDSIFKILESSVIRLHSETWGYRQDLSYFPTK